MINSFEIHFTNPEAYTNSRHRDIRKICSCCGKLYQYTYNTANNSKHFNLMYSSCNETFNAL